MKFKTKYKGKIGETIEALFNLERIRNNTYCLELSWIAGGVNELWSGCEEVHEYAGHIISYSEILNLKNRYFEFVKNDVLRFNESFFKEKKEIIKILKKNTLITTSKKQAEMNR